MRQSTHHSRTTSTPHESARDQRLQHNAINKLPRGPAWSEPQDPIHNGHDCLLYVLLVRFVQSVERDADEVLKLLTTFYVQDTLKQTTTTIQESRF